MKAEFWRRLLGSLLGVALASAALIIFTWVHFLRTPLVYNEQGIRYVVQEGATLHSVVHELYLLDVIKQPFLFNLLVDTEHDQHKLKAGEYIFPKGTTPRKLLAQITTGSGMVYHEFTVIAGWTFQRLRRELLKDPDLKHDTARMSNAGIMAALGHSELKPEGMFFPDTYLFVRGTSDMVVLQKAFARMQKKLDEAWEKRDRDLYFTTPYEALIAASLIEKETALRYERPIIAGVLVNRLRKGMLLQIDPTVIYAAGPNFGGTIRRADLLRKNPYNTYVTKGLPPTPISIPGMESIEAVMHPIHHDYYYFVAKNYDNDGPHRFSATLKEHYQAVSRAKRRKSHMEFFNNDLIWHYISREVLPGIYPA